MKSKITLFFLLLFAQAQATTWYVATSGSDAGAGTLADPLQTLDEAILRASAGDIVELRGGTYTSNEVRVTVNDLTIRSFPGEWAVIAATTTDPNVASCIWYSDPDVVGGTLENLEITGGYYYGLSFETNWDWGVAPQDRHGVRNVTVRGCHIHHTGRDCIKIKPGCDGIQVLGCELDHSGIGPANQPDANAEGIDNVNGDGMVVRNCHIHHTSTSGVYAKGGADGCMIEENLIRETGEAGILLGFYTDADFFDEVVNPNYQECRNSIARNNIVMGTGGAGIGFYACENCRAEHNTVITASPAFHSPLFCANGDIWIDNSTTLTPPNVNLTVVGNIFVDQSGTGAEDYTVQIRPGALTGTTQINQNIYHKTTGAAVFDDGVQWPAMDLAQWRTQSGQDVASIETDPMLDAQAHLSAGSPAIDAAPATATAVDYDFNARTGSPDIGADEFGAGASLTVPPATGVIGTGSANTATAVVDLRPDIQWTVWPNPATEWIACSGQLRWEHLTAQLFDASGRVVATAHQPLLSVRGLPAGSYRLRLDDGRTVVSTTVQVVR